MAWVHLGTVRYHQSVAVPHRVLQVVGLPACIASPSLFFLSCSSCFLVRKLGELLWGSRTLLGPRPRPFFSSGVVSFSGHSSSSSSSWPLFPCLLLSRAAQVCKYFVAELLFPSTNCGPPLLLLAFRFWCRRLVLFLLVSSSSSSSSSSVTTKSLSGGKKHLSTSHCYWICVHCMYVRRYVISGTVHFVHCCCCESNKCGFAGLCS